MAARTAAERLSLMDCIVFRVGSVAPASAEVMAAGTLDAFRCTDQNAQIETFERNGITCLSLQYGYNVRM